MLKQLQECYEAIADKTEKEELKAEMQVLMKKKTPDAFEGPIKEAAQRAAKWLKGNQHDSILFI